MPSKRDRDREFIRPGRRIDFPLSGTWIADHTLGREPFVDIFLDDGEAIISDYKATKCTVTVTHGQPQKGYILIG